MKPTGLRALASIQMRMTVFPQLANPRKTLPLETSSKIRFYVVYMIGLLEEKIALVVFSKEVL